MIKILIVDDEPAAGNILKILIEKNISVDSSVCYSSKPAEALVLLETFAPTLVMLDIEMPGMSGFDFLNKATNSNFDVIFTTAFDKYAIKAIRFSALDYLLKPVDKIELQNALNRHILKQQNHPQRQLLVSNLLNNLQQKDQQTFKLALSTTEGVSFFEPRNIICCEGENNYTRFFFTNHKPILVSKTLGEYEEILTDYQFIRIHKSYLVNSKHIVKLDRENLVWLSDGKSLAVSKRRKEKVTQMLMHKKE